MNILSSTLVEQPFLICTPITLQKNSDKAVFRTDTSSPDGINNRLTELQQELIKKANNKQSYDAIADEIFRLRDQKEKSETDSCH